MRCFVFKANPIVRGLTVGVSLLAFSALPRTASAQQVNWDNYCTTGALQFCASVELNLTDLGGHTAMTVRIRNLEGTMGSTPWGLYEPGFNNLTTALPDFGGESFATLSFGGTARPVATINHSFCNQLFAPDNCADDIDSLVAMHTQEWDYNAGNGRGSVDWTWSGSPWDSPIVGCDVPAHPGSPFVGLADPWGYLQTCGDGWVTYSIDLIGDWSFDDNSSFVFQEGYGGTRADCDPTIWKCELVTPEPATLLLMATGIAGMGTLRKRRRAQRQSRERDSST